MAVRKIKMGSIIDPTPELVAQAEAIIEANKKVKEVGPGFTVLSTGEIVKVKESSSQ